MVATPLMPSNLTTLLAALNDRESVLLDRLDAARESRDEPAVTETIAQLADVRAVRRLLEVG